MSAAGGSEENVRQHNNPQNSLPRVSLTQTQTYTAAGGVCVCTVEPPNNGHVGTSHFVLYREVVLSSDVKVSSIIEKGSQGVSFIERFSIVFFFWSVHY